MRATMIGPGCHFRTGGDGAISINEKTESTGTFISILGALSLSLFLLAKKKNTRLFFGKKKAHVD